MKPRVAVLGCGAWGRNLVRNFHALDALGAVCDPSATARQLAAELAPGTRVAEDWDTVLHDEGITGIALATPAETHADLAVRALRAGKDVLVEKPMALTVAEGESMVAAAREQERLLMVGHLLEYHPAMVRLRELVADGDLGRINYIYSNRLNFGRVRTEENALWSFAPHDIAIILRLAGALPAAVVCEGGSYITGGLADVTVSCLRFANGLRAHVFVSWLHPFKEQRLVVVGDRRMAVFDGTQPRQPLQIYDQAVTLDEKEPVLHRNGVVHPELSDEEPLRAECAHFLARMDDRASPLTDADSGLRVLRVLDACQSSLSNGGQPAMLDHD